VRNYAEGARNAGASFVTSTARDLVLKMIETIDLSTIQKKKKKKKKGR